MESGEDKKKEGGWVVAGRRVQTGRRTGTHRWDMEATPPVRTRPRRGMRLLTLQGPTGGLGHLRGAGGRQDVEQTEKSCESGENKNGYPIVN